MRTALVVTSIHAPNAAMRELAAGCREQDWDFFVAGDGKSPRDYALEGCQFLSLESQRESGFALGKVCPERSYTRKNIGYLAAMRSGVDVIVETDDDNHPKPSFWASRQLWEECRLVEANGWVNVYQYFSDRFIYPRGLPINHARDEVPGVSKSGRFACPIQQGLADSDPDVDAVYRMLFPLPFDFATGGDPVLLTGGAWCPFNSQNTTFFKEAFPLLYLPAHCSFRMTDIWRSFVAQRILMAKGQGVLFHSPTVWQERNEHDLHRDFMDEMVGYTHNARIRQELMALSFRADETDQAMMESCYQTLIRHGWVGKEEEGLLHAWFSDLDDLGVF